MRVTVAGSAVVLIVLGIFLARSAPVVDLDYKVCDLLTGWVSPGKPSGQVVVVEIDERSLAQFGRWPWPRDLLGLLTRRILDRGAATVALDMMFPQEDRGLLRSHPDIGGPPGGANDEVLAEAISGKAVVVGYTLRFDNDDGSPLPCAVPSLPLTIASPNESGAAPFFRATGAVCSVPAVARAAVGSGFLNAAPDRDGKLRRLPVVIEYGGHYYPSLALAAANLYRPVSAMQLVTDAHGAWRLRLGDRTMPLEGPSCLRMRFRGARRTFPYVSAADLLTGRAPAERLRGKIAVVGGSALGLQNSVVAPVDPLFPDVEVQATAIDNLLQGDSFRRRGDAGLWELAFALLAGLTSTVLLARLHAWWGSLIAVGMVAGAWAVCIFVASSAALLFSPLPATATLVCSLPVLILFDYLQEKGRADTVQRQLVFTKQLSREALRESESRYQRLVENVNDAIIVVGLDGRLTFANRRFREWFGLEEAEIRDLVAERYVAPEWRSEVRERNERWLRGELVPDHFEYEGLRPDGTRIWIEAQVAKVEENGRIVGTQAALRDITGRKRIEAQYLQAQKMESVGRLAGGVAHDFNNLLQVIAGYGELLATRLGSDDKSRAYLEQIRKAVEHAAELTQKLLAFSRKQVVQPQRLNLNLVVSEARDMFGRLLGEDIELIARLSPAIGRVMADPGQMHQVLMNLVVNARDAMPNGGKIVIETKNVEVDENLVGQCPGLAPGSYVYLGIADTGTGMNDEVKRHLFEPFYTTKGPDKGTGLGLSTTYGIVQQNAGWIGVASEIGQGATFHIYLPRIKADLSEPPGASPAVALLRGSETVLLVEDQEAVRRLTATILESYGYRVLQASNGPDAIALAERYPETIHLLLSDIILPLMDGCALADHLRAVRPEIGVLYISGYTEDRIGASRGPGREFACLPKPFTSEALAGKIREILAAGGAQSRTA
jgi:PAS domain S-box-containing protein